MQALYQLSYSPSATTAAPPMAPRQCTRPPSPLAAANRLHRPNQQPLSAVVAEDRLGQRSRVVLQQPPAAPAPPQDRPRAVGERPDGPPELLREAEQPGRG